jgi:hypothetical protein
MMKPPVGNTARVLLAAWTLLAAGLAFPPVVHRHSGGNDPHHHDWTESAPGTISFLDVPDLSASSHADEILLSADDLHQHDSLWLLGTVRYLPPTSEPVNPHGKSPCDWEASVVAVLTAPGLRTSSNGTVADSFDLASLVDLAVDCISVPEQGKAPFCSTVPSSLLCDSARHELSGVLLS